MQDYKLRLRTEQEAYEHRLDVDGFRDGEKYAKNASYILPGIINSENRRRKYFIPNVLIVSNMTCVLL